MTIDDETKVEEVTEETNGDTKPEESTEEKADGEETA